MAEEFMFAEHEQVLRKAYREHRAALEVMRLQHENEIKDLVEALPFKQGQTITLGDEQFNLGPFIWISSQPGFRVLSVENKPVQERPFVSISELAAATLV